MMPDLFAGLTPSNDPVPSALGTGPLASTIPVAFNEADARQFLMDLWGTAEVGSLGVWVLAEQSKPSYWAQADEDWWPKLGAKLAAFHGKYNLYANVAIRKPGMFDLKQRGEEADLIALPGLWLDLDLVSQYHGDATFSTIGAAQEFIADALVHHGIDMPPTIVVDSGGGVQAWWLFDEPITELAVMKDISDRWARFWLAQGERLNHKVDWVWQLTQPMRIPGTWNVRAHKLAQTIERTGQRYSPSDIIESFPELTSSATTVMLAKEYGDGEARPADPAAGCVGWLNSKIDMYAEFLKADGWSLGRERHINRYSTTGELVEDHTCWLPTRPGKAVHLGSSASLNMAGLGRLKVFSSSVHVASRNKKTAGKDIVVKPMAFYTFFEYLKEVHGGGGEVGYDFAMTYATNQFDTLATKDEKDAKRQREDTEAAEAGEHRAIVHSFNGSRHLLVHEVKRTLIAQQAEAGLFVDITGMPVRIHSDLNGHATLERLDALGVALLGDTYCAVKRKGTDVSLSKDEAGTVLKGAWHELRTFTGFATAPFVCADSTVQYNWGYEPQSGRWITGGVIEPPIPGVERDQAVMAADALLDGILEGFQFTDTTDRAHALAALITVVCRPMIAGRVPMFVVRADRRGAGKSELVKSIWGTVYGNRSQPARYDRSEPEFAKHLTAILMEKGAPPIIWYDEVNDTVRQSALAEILTNGSFTNRVLRSSSTVSVHNMPTTFFVSGNGIDVAGDLDRRSIRIDLQAWEQGHTWTRHDPEQWSIDHRVNTITQVMTMVRSWIAAGSTRGKSDLPSFNDWAWFVGGVLDHVGVTGFNPQELITLDAMEGDQLTQAWATVLDYGVRLQEGTLGAVDRTMAAAGTSTNYGNLGWTAGDLVGSMVGGMHTHELGALYEVLGERVLRPEQQALYLGRELRKILDRDVLGLVLTESGRARSSARRYLVRRVDEATVSRMSPDRLI